MEKYTLKIRGNLDIFSAHNEDEFDGEITKWREILIHGDPEGLRSLAQILIKIADTNQNEIVGLPMSGDHSGKDYLKPNFSLFL